MSESARELYGAALRAIELDCPAALAAMRAALSGLRVRVELPAESFDLDFEGVPGPDPGVRICTRASVVQDLVLGRDSVLDAILAERLVLYGTPDSLCACSDGLLFFLKGAVRCRSAQSLLLRLERISRDEDAQCPTITESKSQLRCLAQASPG